MKKPIVAVLNDRWRVIDDPVQWILEYRAGAVRPGRTGYTGRRFCGSRRALLWSVDELCGEVDPAEYASLMELPERHVDWD
ncbi:MAG: hypothetical protein OEQ39_04410 [Gammaproteobacteria bacterium]|nr:hypothetical protein [Gammaproteobacteria bacterium]